MITASTITTPPITGGGGGSLSAPVVTNQSFGSVVLSSTSTAYYVDQTASNTGTITWSVVSGAPGGAQVAGSSTNSRCYLSLPATAGSYSITVRATNPDNVTSTGTLSITVSNPAAPPPPPPTPVLEFYYSGGPTLADGSVTTIADANLQSIQVFGFFVTCKLNGVDQSWTAQLYSNGAASSALYSYSGTKYAEINMSGQNTALYTYFVPNVYTGENPKRYSVRLYGPNGSTLDINVSQTIRPYY
jgi:hypothetical protein